MVCPTLRQNLTPWWKPRHARDKPPYSYAALIAHALLSSEHGQLKLKEIYSWISHTYPYYVIGISGWQNSIRHNLSLKKKQFVRLPAKKGGYWKLAKGAEKEFIQILAHPSGRNKRVNKDVPPFIGRDTTFMPMDITVPEDYQSENRHISPPSSSLSPTLSATYWLDFQDTGKINSSPALTPDDSLTPDSSFWTQNDQSTYWLDFQDNHASIPDDMSNPVPFFWTPGSHENHNTLTPDDISHPDFFFCTQGETFNPLISPFNTSHLPLYSDYCNDMTGFDQYFSFDD